MYILYEIDYNIYIIALHLYKVAAITVHTASEGSGPTARLAGKATPYSEYIRNEARYEPPSEVQ